MGIDIKQALNERKMFMGREVSYVNFQSSNVKVATFEGEITDVEVGQLIYRVGILDDLTYLRVATYIDGKCTNDTIAYSGT